MLSPGWLGLCTMDSRIKSANDEFILNQTFTSLPGDDPAIQWSQLLLRGDRYPRRADFAATWPDEKGRARKRGLSKPNRSGIRLRP
jgi:hypothetical protein